MKRHGHPERLNSDVGVDDTPCGAKPKQQPNVGEDGPLGSCPRSCYAGAMSESRDELRDETTAIAATGELQLGPAPRPRRVRLPIILFLLTCLSTFLVGAMLWSPLGLLLSDSPYTNGLGIDGIRIRQFLLANWQDGLIYSVCLITILFAHEMGHFIATLIYRVPASLPYFLPFPISPIGTFGAVISMDGRRPNRREIFDIGIAGPLAGLVIAVPVLWIGVGQLDLGHNQSGPYRIGLPWIAVWMFQWLQPDSLQKSHFVWNQQLNPYLMAGWVGMLITGLNMMPMSQLDGGHVLYALFGRRAHWLARGFGAFAAAYIIYSGQYAWFLMFSIVFFVLGPDHPPTSDDTANLGWFRTTLGAVCLAIPFLCFPVRAII